MPLHGSQDAPSHGERLLYALGQLYRLHRAGELAVTPADFDICDLATIIGVKIEFVTDGPQGRNHHLPGEVLLLDRSQPYPWALLSLGEWAMVEEAIELGQDPTQ